MSIFGKYQNYKNEDLDDYLAAIDSPYFIRKMMTMSSPLIEISIDGDIYIIKTFITLKTMETKFKLDEEYEEVIPSGTLKSVTSRPSDMELITTSILLKDGTKTIRKYTFTDEECVLTLTHDNTTKIAKRYFRRIK